MDHVTNGVRVVNKPVVMFQNGDYVRIDQGYTIGTCYGTINGVAFAQNDYIWHIVRLDEPDQRWGTDESGTPWECVPISTHNLTRLTTLEELALKTDLKGD